MKDNPDKTPAGNETPTRAKRFSLRKFLGRVMLAALAIVIVNTIISANQNFSNRFKEGFYFEKYSDAEEARVALLELHPIGSDMTALDRSLKSAGAYDIQGINEVIYRYIENKGTIFARLWVISIEEDCTSFCSYGAVIKSINVTNQGMAI